MRRRILDRLAAGPPMTARQLAEADSTEPDQLALTRYGKHLRALRDARLVRQHERIPATFKQGGYVSYVLADAARQAMEIQARPKPPRLMAGTHAWDADAAARHLAGENLAVLADKYGVHRATVMRSLRRQGIQVRQGLPRRPRADPDPEWAAEAATRYQAGESLLTLRRAHMSGAERLKRVLRSQGVEIRRRGKKARCSRDQ